MTPCGQRFIIVMTAPLGLAFQNGIVFISGQFAKVQLKLLLPQSSKQQFQTSSLLLGQNFATFCPLITSFGSDRMP